MNTLNKLLIAAIGLLIIHAFLIELIPQYTCIIRYTDHSGWFATVLMLVMMLLNGTFMNTRYFSFAKFGLGVLVLGALFKILHLTGADQVLAFAFLILCLSYVIHFIQKRPKKLVDYFKCLTMLSFAIPIPLMIFSRIDELRSDVEFLRFALLWITFILFVVFERKKLWAKNASTS
jgi:hypothetical protein